MSTVWRTWVGLAARFAIAGALTFGALETAEAQTRTTQEFEAHYERNHARFVCFSNGRSAQLDRVSLLFEDDRLLVLETIGGRGAMRIDGNRFRLPDLSADVTIRRARCDRGVMYRVQVQCFDPCRQSFDGEAAYRQGRSFRLPPPDSQPFFFEYETRNDAEYGARLLRTIIRDADRLR